MFFFFLFFQFLKLSKELSIKHAEKFFVKYLSVFWTRSYFLNRIWVALPSATEPSQTFPTFLKFFSWLKPIVFARLCCFLIRLIGQCSGLEISQNFYLHARINLLECRFYCSMWFARMWQGQGAVIKDFLKSVNERCNGNVQDTGLWHQWRHKCFDIVPSQLEKPAVNTPMKTNWLA